MMYCLDVDRYGKIVQLREGASLNALDGLRQLFLAEVPTDVWDKYVVGDVLVSKPKQPSPYHVFDYAAKQWIDPRTPETEWPLVRAKRDRLIAATDWTQLPDVPLATKEAWANYRQALRDVTLQPDPFNIVWPVAP